MIYFPPMEGWGSIKSDVEPDQEKHVFIKTFLNRFDAFEYINEIEVEFCEDLERNLMVEQCEVKLIGGAYRVGITLVKRQGEFNL